ncbi:cytochrome P460 family protein [Ensifer sp. ENS10]|uniref:cytochrome P460 family protein n=1 Tax=unclassified Ensifer TaxID=2633371 RepID=UPI000DE05D6F|nr:cytochrome P460 family protein [Ensifer sp. ENS10]MBD9510983.1 cytochrome P460 family protein [Ensifer sp. ENS10]
MTRTKLWLGALAFSAAAVDTQVYAEANRVQFPKDLDDLVHYTTVRRSEVAEHIMTTREAVDAVKNGQPIPDGTHFVLVDHRDGKVRRYFVMQKGEGWGNDYPESRRTDDWQFQWFWADKSVNMDENTARCQSCHSSRSGENFLYTFDALGAFDGTVIE